jgi:hypothetical protein
MLCNVCMVTATHTLNGILACTVVQRRVVHYAQRGMVQQVLIRYLSGECEWVDPQYVTPIVTK